MIAAGLGGLGFSVFKEKPPGNYFFASTILMIAILGSVLTDDKRPGPLKIVAAMIVATALHQFAIEFLAPELSRFWLTLQFLAFQTLLVGAMLAPRRRNG
jgi:hypothetical protein